MQRIRVLIVDDSAVIRRILREAFTADSMFEVAGVAANGRIALQMIEQVRPDMVTLDIEMPEMDGLQTLRAIRARHRELPIIMFSTLTMHGAAATIEALSLGATDYANKPADVGSFGQAVTVVSGQLIPKAKAVCSTVSRERAHPVQKSSGRFQSIPVSRRGRVDVLAIGTSTGGPNALAEILPHIPAEFPVPVLIVQHMPPLFTKFLAERLSATCSIPVCEAVAGQRVGPGQAWIAPGDYHMVLKRNGTAVELALEKSPPENSCRPSVDVLFRSVANVYGRDALALVMTGMGQDGLLGCEMIRRSGGQIFVQDEESSVVWGMPGFVARAGLADKVLPLQEIGPELVRVVSSQHGTQFRPSLDRGIHGNRSYGI